MVLLLSIVNLTIKLHPPRWFKIWKNVNSFYTDVQMIGDQGSDEEKPDEAVSQMMLHNNSAVPTGHLHIVTHWGENR